MFSREISPRPPANYIAYKAPDVMIVDDEEYVCRELVEYLRGRGFRANFETDPRSAIATIERDPPLTILVDINMRGIDGTRLVELVQNLGFNGVVILMSGDVDSVYRATADRVNVLHVLEKPIPLELLTRFLRGALAAKSRVSPGNGEAE
jgi:DNA-binding NtrC family response regulator